MNFLDWTHKQITQTHLFNAVTETRHIFSMKLAPRIARCLGQWNGKMGQNIGNPGKLDLKAPTLQGTGCTKLYLNNNSSNFEWGFKTSNHILSCCDGASHQPFLKMLQNNAAPVTNISAYLMLWRRLCSLGQQDQITLCTAWSGQKEESKKWMCHPQVHQTTTCVQKWRLQPCHSSAQSSA